VPLWATAVLFAVALAITFISWFASEKTLSIHSIFTSRRESFYWLAVLFTVTLLSPVVFAAAIALVVLAHYAFKLNVVVAFWIAYILTRPLGASTGDLLAQSPKDGGLGLGTSGTSVLFLGVILLLVVGLTIRERRGGLQLESSKTFELPTA